MWYLAVCYLSERVRQPHVNFDSIAIFFLCCDPP